MLLTSDPSPQSTAAFFPNCNRLLILLNFSIFSKFFFVMFRVTPYPWNISQDTGYNKIYRIIDTVLLDESVNSYFVLFLESRRKSLSLNLFFQYFYLVLNKAKFK